MLSTTLLILENSAIQFMALFGILVLGAIVLTGLSRWTNNVFRQFRFPNFGLYVFGSIGVPVHEFGHALFCRIFFHDVKKVKWFDPRAKGGSLGAVTHLYNPWNPYHRVGHFFIGLGPVLLGPLIILLLLYALVPTARPALIVAFSNDGSLGPTTMALFEALFDALSQAIFQKQTLTSPWFYLFIYLATCISSQMELSSEDLKQAAFGVLPIFMILILLNFTDWYFTLNWNLKLQNASRTLGGLALSVMCMAATLSALNLVLCGVFFNLVNRLTGANSINPFTNQKV